MIDYPSLQHNPTVEKIANAIGEKVGTDERSFFRTHVTYYFCVVASMMRTNIIIPGTAPEPVNMYAINLAPSGFGKGYSTSIIEDYVINQFQDMFLSTTFPLQASMNIPGISLERARKKSADPDDELARTEKEFESLGPMPFSFDSATPPAVKQLRTKLQLASAGSINLQTDEIGSNLMANKDVMDLFLELFNGKTKSKLIKNTADSLRSEDLKGLTPTNMMLFGVGSALLDGGKIEEELLNMFTKGFGRRSFFGYVPDDFKEKPKLLTPEERLNQAINGTSDTVLQDISDHLGTLANGINMHKKIVVPEATALRYYEYQNDCDLRAFEFKDHELLLKAEMRQRFFKAIKIAGSYAFVEQSPEITIAHLESAIALAEESGDAFKRIMNRERSYVRLARYLANTTKEVTQADLTEDLPFYPKTKSLKDEMIIQAIAWGYKNSISIKKRYADGIEFFSGEALTETDLNKMLLSHSADIVSGYNNAEAPFNKLHKLTNLVDRHWVNHRLASDDGKSGYRDDDHCIPGFNMLVIDVDDNTPLELAKSLLTDYKALYYTTKRHTPENNRFRIILPTNYTLKLNKEDYKEFMNNVFEWLPFKSDTQTGQRSRKWLSHNGHYEYTDGILVDVLPFIPKTAKNEQRKDQFKDVAHLESLERWFINNTGDGNRNNQLLRYALLLVDGQLSYNNIQKAVSNLNSKLADKLDDTELMMTIMKTVKKNIDLRIPEEEVA